MRPLLCSREIQILECICRGKNNEEIAEELNMKKWTVVSHLEEIFYKLDADNRTLAVINALKLGLLTPENNIFKDRL